MIDNLWDYARQEAQLDSFVPDAFSKVLLVLGQRAQGQRQLLQKLLGSSPSMRTASSADTFQSGLLYQSGAPLKEGLHVYQLAGGKSFKDLIITPFISLDTLQRSAIIVVGDLSQPQTLLSSLKYWLDTLRNTIQEFVRSQPGDKAGEFTRKIIAERLKPESQEPGIVDPILARVAIVCTRYDIFENEEPSKRKPLARALRFLAFQYSASLCFVSLREKSKFNNFDHWIRNQYETTVVESSTAKEGEQKKEIRRQKFHVSEIKDLTKQLMIQAGNDTLVDQGLKEYRGMDILGRLKADVTSMYGKLAEDIEDEPKEDKKIIEFDSKFGDFKEAKIDSMRAQKEEELLQIRKQNERMKRFQKQVEVKLREKGVKVKNVSLKKKGAAPQFARQ